MLTIKKILTTEEVENYLTAQGISLPMDYQQFMGVYDGDTLIGMGRQSCLQRHHKLGSLHKQICGKSIKVLRL